AGRRQGLRPSHLHGPARTAQAARRSRPRRGVLAVSAGAAAIWHDVECGSYDADLPLWEELAEGCDGPVLELGCGTGRVSLHLARRGHRVVGLDREPVLLAALADRGGDLPVRTLEADAREFALDEPADLVLAPTHLLQLLADPAERAR